MSPQHPVSPHILPLNVSGDYYTLPPVILILLVFVCSSRLDYRILWTEEPGGLLSIGSHRVEHD